MSFIFYETGGVEAGIDGVIELRDEDSWQVRNMILQVQVKATEQRFSGETEESFTFACTEADIAYWREGTAPVLLMVVRPSDGVAYWKSIKEWFADPERLRTRKVAFDKRRALLSRDSPGAVPPSVRIEESLISN